eukprot:13651878-Heterocapsa_arctica.AAC.1
MHPGHLAVSVVSVVASTVQLSVHGLRVHPSSATDSRWPRPPRPISSAAARGPPWLPRPRSPCK